MVSVNFFSQKLNVNEMNFNYNRYVIGVIISFVILFAPLVSTVCIAQEESEKNPAFVIINYVQSDMQKKLVLY